MTIKLSPVILFCFNLYYFTSFISY